MATTKKKRKDLKFKIDRTAVRSIRTTILADIKRIRAAWASGYTDLEIRDKLNLDFRAWKKRLRTMRAVPPDEDTIASYRRYYQEHVKTISKLQSRLKEMKKIHRQASEQIDVFSNKIDPKTKKQKILYSKPRNLSLAQSTARAMADLDKDMLEAEGKLIEVKQKLGIIEDPNAKNPFQDEMLTTLGNLMDAWSLRRQRKLERKEAAVIDVTPAPEKSMVNGKA